MEEQERNLAERVRAAYAPQSDEASKLEQLQQLDRAARVLRRSSLTRSASSERSCSA